jgi:hypothetical protein
MKACAGSGGKVHPFWTSAINSDQGLELLAPAALHHVLSGQWLWRRSGHRQKCDMPAATMTNLHHFYMHSEIPFNGEQWLLSIAICLYKIPLVWVSESHHDIYDYRVSIRQWLKHTPGSKLAILLRYRFTPLLQHTLAVTVTDIHTYQVSVLTIDLFVPDATPQFPPLRGGSTPLVTTELSVPGLFVETLSSQRISGGKGMETTKKLLQFYVAERPLFIAIRPLDAAQSTHTYRLLFRAQAYRLLASCWIPPKNSHV